MKVIGVVGLPASGKGEFAKIAAAAGIPVIVMGDMIRNAVKASGREPTDTNFGAMANKLRSERGMDAIAHLCVPEDRTPDCPARPYRWHPGRFRGEGVPSGISGVHAHQHRFFV